MVDDSAYENERRTWQGIFHASAQAEAAHEVFHRNVQEPDIFPEASGTLIVPAY